MPLPLSCHSPAAASFSPPCFSLLSSLLTLFLSRPRAKLGGSCPKTDREGKERDGGQNREEHNRRFSKLELKP